MSVKDGEIPCRTVCIAIGQFVTPPPKDEWGGEFDRSDTAGLIRSAEELENAIRDLQIQGYGEGNSDLLAKYPAAYFEDQALIYTVKVCKMAGDQLELLSVKKKGDVAWVKYRLTSPASSFVVNYAIVGLFEVNKRDVADVKSAHLDYYWYIKP